MFFDGTDETYVVKQHFTPEQAAKARKKAAISFTPELERLIEECSKKCVAPKDFYSKIWSIIQSSTFRTKREKAIALFFLVNHDLIPYRPVGLGISMEQKKYVNILESLPDSMWDDTRYLLKLNYEQKTQRASILLDKLLALSNKEDQIVYLAALLDEVKQNAQEEVKESVEYALENI